MVQSSKPYSLRIRISSTPSSRQDVLELARSQFGPIQVLPGCLGVRLMEDIEKKGVFQWEENWSSLELLEKRVASDSFHTVLTLIDISSGSPEITVNGVINEHGMNWIASIRQKQENKP